MVSTEILARKYELGSGGWFWIHWFKREGFVVPKKENTPRRS
jgi:hypothetical protein